MPARCVVCREKRIELMLESGNTVRTPPVPIRKSAAAGVEALIWFRICSSGAVMLCVVKRGRDRHVGEAAARRVGPAASWDMFWCRSLRNDAGSIG